MDTSEIKERIESVIYDNTEGRVTASALAELLKYIVDELGNNITTASSIERKVDNAYSKADSLRTNQEQNDVFLSKADVESTLQNSVYISSVVEKINKNREVLISKYPDDFPVLPTDNPSGGDDVTPA